MPRQITFLNGEFVPHENAFVHIDDRGFTFADGIYDFILVHKGCLINEEAHLDRVDYSLGEMQIDRPLSRDELKVTLREMIARNELVEGFVYMQFTRGVSPRDHPFPPKGTRATSVITARHMPFASWEQASEGVAVITLPDERWKRCDIKSLAILPNILAREKAVRAGASEAWMFDEDGFVTEGPACNAWIITREGAVVTRHLDRAILSGVTRRKLRGVLESQGITLEERKFSVEEAKNAAEAYLTNSPYLVKPVVKIDDTPIGNGKAGPVTLQILKAYRAALEEQCEDRE
ncbi:MAG: D-amino-acid transaminase [Rhodospirillales bacterium]|nr:D-amino-acid transaminase [Alphaproteobacteria bacterium]MBL6929116.1 D-amino-acid transaminase [Rhodospirillales bacterium]